MGKGPMGFGPIVAKQRQKGWKKQFGSKLVDDVVTDVKWATSFEERAKEAWDAVHPGPKSVVRKVRGAPGTVKDAVKSVKDKGKEYASVSSRYQSQDEEDKGVRKELKGMQDIEDLGDKLETDEDISQLVRFKIGALMQRVKDEKNETKRGELADEYIKSLEKIKKERSDKIDAAIEKQKKEVIQKGDELRAKGGPLAKGEDTSDIPKKISAIKHDILKLKGLDALKGIPELFAEDEGEEGEPLLEKNSKAKKDNPKIKALKAQQKQLEEYQNQKRKLDHLYILQKQDKERFGILADNHKQFLEAMGVDRGYAAFEKSIAGKDQKAQKEARDARKSRFDAMYYARSKLDKLEQEAETAKPEKKNALDKGVQKKTTTGLITNKLPGVRSSVTVESHDGKESIHVNFGRWGKEATAKAAALTSISKGWEKVNVIASKNPKQDRAVMYAHAKEYAAAYDLSPEKAMERVSYKSEKNGKPQSFDEGIKASITAQMRKDKKWNTEYSKGAMGAPSEKFTIELNERKERELKGLTQDIEKYTKDNKINKGEIADKRNGEITSGEYTKEVSDIYIGDVALNIAGNITTKGPGKPKIQAALFDGVAQNQMANVYGELKTADGFDNEQFLNNLNPSSRQQLYLRQNGNDQKANFLKDLNQDNLNELYLNVEDNEKKTLLSNLDDDPLKELYKSLDNAGKKDLFAKLGDDKKSAIADVEAASLQEKIGSVNNADTTGGKQAAKANLTQAVQNLLEVDTTRGLFNSVLGVLEKNDIIDLAKNITTAQVIGKFISACNSMDKISTLLSNIDTTSVGSLQDVISQTVQVARQNTDQDQVVKNLVSLFSKLPTQIGDENDQQDPQQMAIEDLYKEDKTDDHGLYKKVKAGSEEKEVKAGSEEKEKEEEKSKNADDSDEEEEKESPKDKTVSQKMSQYADSQQKPPQSDDSQKAQGGTQTLELNSGQK